MKLLTFPGPQTMLQRTKGLIKTGFVKTGQASLVRISAELGKKEYPVFVEPLKALIPNRFKYGLRRALLPFSGKNGAAEAMGTPETLEPTPGDLSPAGESMDEYALIKEIFVRPAPVFDEPIEEPVEPSENLQDPAPEADQEDDSADTGPEPVDASENTQAQARNAPLVHTMVEASPDLPAGEGGLSDFLSEDLQDIFNVVDYTNPKTKALLRSREHIDIYELAKELDEYARSIGAVPPNG